MTHRAHILALNGDSYRLRERLAQRVVIRPG
ncbi:MAG: hypothetical protein M0031_01440 [Thermaerobacter sp.]|nr:hypothetical protein [Thermaerobacter sp.]